MPLRPGCPLSDEWLFSDPMQIPLLEEPASAIGGCGAAGAADRGSRSGPAATAGNPESVSSDDLSL